MNGKPPKTVPEWIEYLHAARAVPQDSPDYGEAQEAVRFALQRIRTLNTVANAGDQAAAEQGKRIGQKGNPLSGPLAAGATNAANAASLGLGQPIAGVIDALLGGSFGQGAGRYRQGLENIQTQQPVASSIGDVLGMGAMAAVPVSQGVQAGTNIARQATQGVRGPNILARFTLGATQTPVTAGATMGAIQGFSAGGADPGDMQARLRGGAVGAGMGAAGQALFGGLGALRVPRWLSSVRKDIRAGMPKGTDPKLVAEVEEAALRAGMARDGYSAETQDRILTAWRAGKTTVPSPLPPPAQRPGETVVPTARPGERLTPIPGTQGLEVTGTRATPPAPTQESPLHQNPWADVMDAAARDRSNLLPQDVYASTADLKSMLKMGPKYGIEGDYAKAIRAEIARRAKGILPPNTVR